MLKFHVWLPHSGMDGKLDEISGQGIWTPGEVLRYARELASKNTTNT